MAELSIKLGAGGYSENAELGIELRLGVMPTEEEWATIGATLVVLSSVTDRYLATETTDGGE